MALRVALLGAAGGKFGGGGNGFKSMPGKHFLKKPEECVAQEAIGGKHFPAVETEGTAIEGGYGSAGFKDQQRSSGSIPGIQVEFPVSVYAAACRICKVKSRRARTAHSMRAQGELLIEVNVWIVVALA